jgi:cytochrome P450
LSTSDGDTRGSGEHEASTGCPIDHAAFSRKKLMPASGLDGAAIERDAAGVWQVRSYEVARALLRESDTKQAGFRAELVERFSSTGNAPILYQEGKAHQQQRKQTARFFTPKAVSSDYHELMETVAERLISGLRTAKRADLSALSLALAVRVAAEVVGLTNSRLPGIDKRLEAFFTGDATAFGWSPRALLRMLRTQARVAAFFYLDVRPAIVARRRTPREDVISHLIAQGYSDAEILTECITYGAAGMITTREFISIAAWHFLEQPELRTRYLAALEEERQQMLQEILRLEPVVGHLYRRATADITVESGGATITIPKGDLMDLHIHAVNADEGVVGAHPQEICPARELRAERVGPAVMGFGDGHHRCPGSYIAIQETDIFLRRLLALDGLHLVRPPTIAWNELVTGYELRDLRIAFA